MINNNSKTLIVEILGRIIEYEEDDETDWVGIEELIKEGQTEGNLFRYRTAIVVGKWWIKK